VRNHRGRAEESPPHDLSSVSGSATRSNGGVVGATPIDVAAERGARVIVDVNPLVPIRKRARRSRGKKCSCHSGPYRATDAEDAPIISPRGREAGPLESPPDRAFVLHLDTRARPPQHVVGRVEHVTSGCVAHVTSLRGLVAFLVEGSARRGLGRLRALRVRSER
jgi:hypothetical protein